MIFNFGKGYCQHPFFSSVPFLSGWLRASDGLTDTRYILIHPTLPTHKYKRKTNTKRKTESMTKKITTPRRRQRQTQDVNIFCQHLTRAKQLVLVKTNKEGWKQSKVLHTFGKLVKHSCNVWIRIYCV